MFGYIARRTGKWKKLGKPELKKKRNDVFLYSVEFMINGRNVGNMLQFFIRQTGVPGFWQGLISICFIAHDVRRYRRKEEEDYYLQLIGKRKKDRKQFWGCMELSYRAKQETKTRRIQ